VTVPQHVHVVGAALIDGERCLVARRGPGRSLAGLWELPGGKVGAGESRRAALARELLEELGVRARIGDWLGRGESLVDGRGVVLDVYAAALDGGVPRPREHAELRWVRGDELDALAWAHADVPVLPAIRSRLRTRPRAQGIPDGVALVSADWGKEPRKRAAYVARPAPRWRIERAAPPGGGWSLAALTDLARALRAEGARSVLVGIDAVLGLPAAFARGAAIRDFPSGLAQLAGGGGLEKEATSPADWSVHTPFFRVPPGRGGLSGFVHAAGGRSGVLRQIELRTGAKPVFAVSGIPGTVGSGTRALWRELAPVLRDPRRDLRLWPFDGPLHALLEPGAAVLAETYPRASYAVALAPELPAKPRALAKTRPAVRQKALAKLASAGWLRRHRVELRDLDAAQGSEDDFDALLVAAGLVRLLAERHALGSAEPVDPRAEGGILGTGAVSLRVPGLTATP